MRIKGWVARVGAVCLLGVGCLGVGVSTVGDGTVPVCVTEDQAGVCMWEGTVRSWDPDKVTGMDMGTCETWVVEDGYGFCDG